MPLHLLNVAILGAFVLNVSLTALSITGVYGHTNDELSRKYQSLVTPAGWAFAIWGIIFSSEAVYAVVQLLPAFRGSAEVQQAGPWFIVACCFQAGWNVAFGSEALILSQVLMLLILASLWRMNVRLLDVATASPAPPSWSRYLLCYLPFTVHFGWLTAASLVSTNLTLVAFAPHSHVALLTVAVISLTVLFLPGIVNPATAREGSDPGYALTTAWALAGVAFQLRSPMAGAPAKDPIPSWCPPLVTEALSIVAAALSAATIAAVAARALAKVLKGYKGARSGSQRQVGLLAAADSHIVDPVVKP